MRSIDLIVFVVVTIYLIVIGIAIQYVDQNKVSMSRFVREYFGITNMHINYNASTIPWLPP